MKLIGVDRKVWVQESNLSGRVVQSFKGGKSLPKNVKAYVDRVYVDKQQMFLTTQNSRKDDDSVVKAARKCYRWSGVAHQYVHVMNKVLDTPLGSRKEAVNDMFTSLDPPKFIKSLLQTSKFIDGTFVRSLDT